MAKRLEDASSKIEKSKTDRLRRQLRICEAAVLLRAEFDEVVSLFQLFNSIIPERFKPGEHRAIRTVTLPNPNKWNGLVAQNPVIDEVFVLADDDGAVVSSALPNYRIVGGVESQIEDMYGVMAFAVDPTRQCWRELRIDEEVHAGCRTAWSAWRAA
jgi:hypothetical protein